MTKEPDTYTATFSVCFSKPGLTPSYQLKDRYENVVIPRTTTGIMDMGNGQYSAFIPIHLNFKGKLEWCSEEGVPEFKHEVIGREFTDEIRKKLQELSKAKKVGWWRRNLNKIIIGVIITVVGGLILAFIKSCLF